MKEDINRKAAIKNTRTFREGGEKMKVKPKRFILACLSLLCIVFVLSCEDNEFMNGEKGFVVSGKLTDSVTTLPIDSVLMSWGDTLIPTHDTLTDTTGNYSLLVPQSTRIIYARKAGYKTKGREIQNLNSNVSNFNFEVVSN